MAITFVVLQIDGICFVRVHSLSMSMSPDLALLPGISVSRSSKPAAFPGFNRLRPVASSFVQAEMLSKLSWWLVVTWNDCFLVLNGCLRCSTLLPLDNSWLAIWSAVTVLTTGGDIVCSKTTDGCPCFFANHGEVGVFHHVSPYLTSFIRDFIR